jgi:hypothetical protein
MRLQKKHIEPGIYKLPDTINNYPLMSAVDLRPMAERSRDCLLRNVVVGTVA